MPPSLDACLKKSGVKLSREHRAFLRDHATSLPVDDDHPPPPRASAEAKRGSAPAWAKDVSVLFGANDLVKQLTQKQDDIGFWDRRMNRFAVAIGRCFDGDVLVQVTGGRHAGHILRINHDEYYGLFEHLPKLGGSRLPPALTDRLKPVLRRLGYRKGAATCDQIVGALLDDELEGAERIARSFNELYQALLRAFRPLKPPGRDVTLTRLDVSADIVGCSTSGLLITTHDRLYLLGPRRTITQLGRPERNNPIVCATITNTGTLLAKMWLGATEMRRSTTGGRMWKRLSVKDREIKTMHCTSTGTVVLGGKKLWISRDDGETFAPLPVRLRGTVDALAEAGGELLIGAGDLYRLPVP